MRKSEKNNCKKILEYCEKFYKDFYMNFVFPLGIAKINHNNNETNCNYYEIKNFEKVLYKYIVESLRKILTFNIDTSVCYCIGSGENYKFLIKINKEYNFFKEILPLEHPRFIMQYNSKNKDVYLKKYITSLSLE